MRALDKRLVKAAAKGMGFNAKGNFLVGLQNSDIISGFAIDGAPSSTYIWTFILPAFDDIEFMSMSLGERVINLNSMMSPINEGLEQAWSSISSITNASQLVSYINSSGIVGEYAEWTRFICFIRLGEFRIAEEMLSSIGLLKSMSIPIKLREIEFSRSYGGWAAAQDLLGEWSARTELLTAR